VKKCEKTEQLLRNCVGRYVPSLRSNLDVSLSLPPFNGSSCAFLQSVTVRVSISSLNSFYAHVVYSIPLLLYWVAQVKALRFASVFLTLTGGKSDERLLKVQMSESRN
jgi:hypothetical protein